MTKCIILLRHSLFDVRNSTFNSRNFPEGMNIHTEYKTGIPQHPSGGTPVYQTVNNPSTGYCLIILLVIIPSPVTSVTK